PSDAPTGESTERKISCSGLTQPLGQNGPILGTSRNGAVLRNSSIGSPTTRHATRRRDSQRGVRREYHGDDLDAGEDAGAPKRVRVARIVSRSLRVVLPLRPLRPLRCALLLCGELLASASRSRGSSCVSAHGL